MLNVDFRNYLIQDTPVGMEGLEELPEEIANIFKLDRLRNFSLIYFNGGYALSIQASATHYSHPRDTLQDVFKYTAFEVAMRGYSGEFLNLKKEFGIDYLEEYYDDTIYGYVPVESIQKAFDYMANRFGIQPSHDYFKQ